MIGEGRRVRLRLSCSPSYPPSSGVLWDCWYTLPPILALRVDLMNARDLFKLALRGLSRRAVRTALTVAGIVVAVASMVIFLSLGEGIRQVFRSQLSEIGPDIQVSVDGIGQGGIPTPNVPVSLAAQLEAKKNEYGIKSVTPVLLSVRSSVSLDGQNFVFYTYPTVQPLKDLIPGVVVKQGRLLTPEDEGKLVAVIGSKAAENGGFKLGSDVRFNRRSFFKVVGILEPGGGFTDSFILVPLSTMQKAQNLEGRSSYIALKLNDPSSARKVAEQIKTDFKLEAQTQSDFLKIIDRAITASDAIRFGISLISLIVGGLAVANTVMMGVFERTKEFGTMRAIGAQPSFVRSLVLLESLLLSILGGIGGIILGYLGILVVNYYTQDLAGINGAALTGRLIGFAVLVSLVIGLLAGLLPARSAGRIVITQALGRN